MKTIWGLACGLVLASAGLAGAQVITETQTTTTAPATGATTGVRRISQLLGATVQLQGVNNFGRVEDAVLDENGAIAFLVVSSNSRSVMLPWSEANFNTGQRVVTYNVSPQVVQPLYFETSAWPNVWEPQYMTRVRRIFPRAGIIRREVLRPVVPVAPPGTTVLPPATAVPPGGVVEEKIEVKTRGPVR